MESASAFLHFIKFVIRWFFEDQKFGEILIQDRRTLEGQISKQTLLEQSFDQFNRLVDPQIGCFFLPKMQTQSGNVALKQLRFFANGLLADKEILAYLVLVGLTPVSTKQKNVCFEGQGMSCVDKKQPSNIWIHMLLHRQEIKKLCPVSLICFWYHHKRFIGW